MNEDSLLSNAECLGAPVVRFRNRFSFLAGLTNRFLHGTKSLRPMKWRVLRDDGPGSSLAWRPSVGFPGNAVFAAVESAGCDPMY